jgi:hypothetical protein
MKYLKFILVISLFISIQGVFAQDHTKRDSVEIRLNNKVYKDGRQLTMRGLENLFRLDEEASASFKRAKLNFQFSQAAYVVGAVLIITPAAISLTDDEAPWAMAGVGLASIGAGLLLSSAKNKWLRESVRIYHENLAQSGAFLNGGNTFGITYALRLN